jgi:hypothetical protein
VGNTTAREGCASAQVVPTTPTGSDVVQHHENENKPLTYACFFVRRPNYYRIGEVKPNVPVIQYSHARERAIGNLVIGQTGGEFCLPGPIMTVVSPLIFPRNVDNQELMNGLGHTGATLSDCMLFPSRMWSRRRVLMCDE